MAALPMHPDGEQPREGVCHRFVSVGAALAAVMLGAGLFAEIEVGPRAAVWRAHLPLAGPQLVAPLARTKKPFEVAQSINAALPFDQEPIRAAAPFVTSSNEVELSRAELCLTQAVYYEAGFEPLPGRRAVAQVILNRVRHPAYPRSICAVVHQRSSRNICQFTFVCDGSLHNPPSPVAWTQAREIAAAALAGYVEETVGLATHYHADYVAPNWAPLLAKVIRIGEHIFYRWPAASGRSFSGAYIGEPEEPLAIGRAQQSLLVEEIEVLELVSAAAVDQEASKGSSLLPVAAAILDPLCHSWRPNCADE